MHYPRRQPWLWLCFVCILHETNPTQTIPWPAITSLFSPFIAHRAHTLCNSIDVPTHALPLHPPVCHFTSTSPTCTSSCTPSSPCHIPLPFCPPIRPPLPENRFALPDQANMWQCSRVGYVPKHNESYRNHASSNGAAEPPCRSRDNRLAKKIVEPGGVFRLVSMGSCMQTESTVGVVCVSTWSKAVCN